MAQVDLGTRIDHLLSRKMDRREFLIQAGTLVVALVGITAMLKSLGLKEAHQTAGSRSSAYGGKRLGR